MALGSALQSRTGLLLIHKSITVFLNFAFQPNYYLCLEIITDASHLIMLNVILVQVYIISSSKNYLDYKSTG